ncbi:MAG: DUF3362 domain-containing protein, partial [Clostridia bacterium]|nr:DUF3362 domain-containing protein [Clostridia bacterium]
LKVAPEHISQNVLSKMGKPRREVYDAFVAKYKAINEKLGLKQFLVPYLMSSHPGSTLTDAIELAEYLRDINHQPEQVQDFYPTPGTLSTCMYHTGIDPRDMKPVYVPKTFHEKAMQRALLQFKNPANHSLVCEALRLAGRDDLIGFSPECLVAPRPIARRNTPAKHGRTTGKSNTSRSDPQHSTKNKPSTRTGRNKRH